MYRLRQKEVITIKKELKKYIGKLSLELQEKARQCKTNEELNALLAENDVELSEDALQAVAGGCSSKKPYHKVCGELLPTYLCNKCQRTVTKDEIEWK